MGTETTDDTTISKLAEAGVVRSAHEAAAYDKWLEAEIQEAIDDTSPTIPHDEAMRDVRAVIKSAKTKRTSA